MCTPLACSDYYEASAPSHGHQPTTDVAPDPGPDARMGGGRGWFPRSPHDRSARSAPSSTPAASPSPTPQSFSVASPPVRVSGFGVDHPTLGQSCAAPRPRSGPDPPDLEPVQPLRGFYHWFTRVTPSGLACRTRLVWQYRAVPTLSGLLSALPAVPRLRLPPASTGLLRQPGDEGFTPPLGHRRLVAHSLVVERHPALVPSVDLHIGGVQVDRDHRAQPRGLPLG